MEVHTGMKMNKLVAMSLALSVALFTSCGSTQKNLENGLAELQSSQDNILNNQDITISSQSTEASNEAQNGLGNEISELQIMSEEMFSDRDKRNEYDTEGAVTIQLQGDKASCGSNSDAMSEGILTLSEEATYIISGELTDGMIIVDAPEDAKLQLVLQGVDITSKTSAAIYVKSADKVFITLAEGSENVLSNGGEYVAIDENQIDGTIFSKEDLTINGLGQLSISSSAGHGIVCKDDLAITGGNIEIESASHGLDANDSVRIALAKMSILAGKDGIHVENSDDETKGFVYIESGQISIEAEGDGISASAYMDIEDGAIEIVAGGGSENGTKASSDNYGRRPNGNFKRGGFGNTEEMSGGNRPEFSGEMPEGNRPEFIGEMPEGSRPEFSGEMSEGSRPEFGGEMPEGNRSELSEESQKDTISDQEVENTVDVTEESTSMKGLKAGGILQISGGSICIDSADDSIHSNDSILIKGGEYTLKTGDDGIHADEILIVNDGNIQISESYEGLEALHITINGGNLTIVSRDDGINAAGGTNKSGTEGGRDGAFGGKPMGMSAGNGSVVINNGTIFVYASGDGIDSNGSLEITGGYVEVSGPTQGDTSVLDFDTTGTITGGTFIGTGAASMPQNFIDYSQGVVFSQVGKQAAGTLITLKDESGNVILEHTPDLDFELVIISSSNIQLDGEYILSVGDYNQTIAGK